VNKVVKNKLAKKDTQHTKYKKAQSKTESDERYKVKVQRLQELKMYPFDKDAEHNLEPKKKEISMKNRKSSLEMNEFNKSQVYEEEKLEMKEDIERKLGSPFKRRSTIQILDPELLPKKKIEEEDQEERMRKIIALEEQRKRGMEWRA